MKKILLARSRRGFSLIEIAAVIGIVVIISVVAFTNLGGRRNTVDLNNTTQQIASTLREAQSKAMSQTSGQVWGVHFENAATPFYSIFSGSTYSASAEVGHYKLPNNVCFSNISSGSSQDIIFSQVSGQPSGGATSIGLQSTSGCSVAAGGSGGGSGPEIESWSTTTAMSGERSTHSAVVNNGYVYVIGGTTDVTYVSTVFYAPINENGTVGSWSTTTELPNTLYDHSSVVNNGYIYTVGGYASGAGATSTVLYAPINENGTVGSWSTTTALPSGRYLHSVVVNNGYMYTIGGNSASVFYAPINGNGTLGSWSETTEISQLERHSSVVNNGYIYVTGGLKSGVLTSTVLYAPINGNGTVGSWSTTTAMPNATDNHSSVVNNGYIYTTGGNTGGGVEISTVSYAQINENGTIGSWSTATALPDGTGYHSAVVNNGYIYTVGGVMGNAVVPTVFYARFSNESVIATSTVTVSSQGQITF